MRSKIAFLCMVFRSLCWTHGYEALKTTCAPYHGPCVRLVTSASDPHIVAVTSPTDKFHFLLLLRLKRSFTNIYIYIFFSFSSLDFLYFFLVGLSIFVAFLRHKWCPSADLLSKRLFLLTNKLKICSPTVVHVGDIWDSNFELWTRHLVLPPQRISLLHISFSVSFCRLNNAPSVKLHCVIVILDDEPEF
jgi:hypothetical protein